VWTKEYNDVKEHADDLYELIRERNAIASNGQGAGGNEVHRLSAQCRRKMGALSNKISRLEEIVAVSKGGGAITNREAARRTDLINALVVRRDQLKDILSNKDNDRKRLLGTATSSLSQTSTETNETAGLDSSGILQLQKRALQTQDDQIAELGQVVQSTKHVALAINEEVDLHQRLLDDLEDGVEHTTGYLSFAQRRLKQIANRSGNCRMICIIILLVIVLAVILSLAMKLNN